MMCAVAQEHAISAPNPSEAVVLAGSAGEEEVFSREATQRFGVPRDSTRAVEPAIFTAAELHSSRSEP